MMCQNTYVMYIHRTMSTISEYYIYVVYYIYSIISKLQLILRRFRGSKSGKVFLHTKNDIILENFYFLFHFPGLAFDCSNYLPFLI